MTPTCRRPFTEYGLSKVRAEEWLRPEGGRRGIALTILRPVTVYGPGCRPNTVQGVLKHGVLRRSFLSRVQWPGQTGFIHVEDLAGVLLALVESAPPAGHAETY